MRFFLYSFVASSRSHLFTSLMAEKTNPVFWRRLSTDEALGFDYKLFEQPIFSGRTIAIGTASILLSLQGQFVSDDGQGSCP